MGTLVSHDPQLKPPTAPFSVRSHGPDGDHPALTTSTTISWRRNLRSGAWSCGDKEAHEQGAPGEGTLMGFVPATVAPRLRISTLVRYQSPRSPPRPSDDGKSRTRRRKQVAQPGVTQKEQKWLCFKEKERQTPCKTPIRTSSIPSMWDSISCTIRAFLSTSSALFMPLLILSATCLMLR